MPSTPWRSPAAFIALVTLAIALLWAGVRGAQDAQPGAAAPSNAATEEEARAACGTACHAFPPPDILPRSVWRDTVARMMLISQGATEPAGPVGTAGRTVVLPPDLQRVLRYYQARAPQTLPAPAPWPAVDASGFRVQSYAPPDPPPAPAISHVRFLDLDDDGRLEAVASDMRYGLIAAGRPWDKDGRMEVIGTIPNPSHFEPFDFDGDGTTDLLVADLGSFQPADHTQGSVVWMRGLKRGRFSQFSLDGWPRVADVQAGDFNGDSKPDLLVASFGWRKVGRIAVLQNQTTRYEQPAFANHDIDPRSGSIHAVPADLNGDGRLDFVALLAQQHESVVAYLNTGTGIAFTTDVIYAAPHPNWGSSGIQLVDMDKDGDVDVLLTHGDTFDDQIVKPYHGIMWLENRGSYPYVPHPLADLPGAFRAQAGDLDGDGDLDVVACAFIAGGADLDESNMPALVWLEQVKPGVFERRTLARRPPRHPTLDLADYDGDGDLDILVGIFATSSTQMPWIEIWENTRAPLTTP